jgi:hypothetical protein
MATSTRINGFLWHRVSQGYSRVVGDQPPFESWRAWRAGYRDYRPAPYLTPASSSVRELPSELDGASAAAVAVAVAELATKGSSSNSGAGGYDTRVRTVTAPPMLAAAAAAAAASTSFSGSTVTPYSEGAATGSRRGVGGVVAGVTGDGDWDQEGEELEYEDVKVLTTTPTGPPHSQEWAFPSWSSGQSQASSSSSSSSSSGIGQLMSTNTSGQGRSFCQRQISFKLNAPEDMEFAVIQCTLTKRREGVKNGKHVPPRSVTYGCLTLDFLLETQLKVDYAENLS